MTDRKDRIAQAFAAQAGAYDAAADVQWMVADRLADRVTGATLSTPARILEIGCGTGFLSARLAEAFPESALLFTDIAPTMLARCRARLGDRHRYLVLDGERPDGLEGGYDLIVSNLTFQWFVDLAAACQRLSGLLAPGGRLAFATLGRQTFGEWRQAHAALGLSCGTPQYPTAEEFPWPDGIAGHTIAEELIRHRYDNGHDFARSLKVLGASEPAPGYRPLSPGAFRKLLASLAGGFTVTYHILFGEITA